MDVGALTALLDSRESLPAVARSLGLDCLQRRSELERERYVRSQTIIDLAETVYLEGPTMWADDGTRTQPLSARLASQLVLTTETPALATLTVLDALCYGVLRTYYLRTSSIIYVERGAAVPLPQRWLPNIGATTNPTSTHCDLLSEDSNFIIWNSEWTVELDFRFRDRIDDVCAERLEDEDEKGENGNVEKFAYALPKIATVHPFGKDGMATIPDEMVETRFFGVHPVTGVSSETDDDKKAVTHEDVFAALAKVGEAASIAVLPEFCLHAPDGLDNLIAETVVPLPPLIVAGSAHTGGTERKERANVSHVFLDGFRMLEISKYEPFVLRLKDPATRKQYLFREDIAPRPPVLRVAAGTATRLVVAICADINTDRYAEPVRAIGANVFLSPSWTPKRGRADAFLRDLSAHCQCVGVVANTPGHLMATTPPFWACSSAPRENGHAKYHFCRESPPMVGILDPNLAPSNKSYWKWLA